MTTTDLERRLQNHSDLTKIGEDTRSLLREAALALSTACDEGPGTPMWRLNKLAEWTEKELWHNSTSSRGFEQTIIERVSEMKSAWKYRHELLAERHRELQEKYDLLRIITWMVQRGYETGHGDVIEDLLSEIDWQAQERGAKTSHSDGE